jgi:hypothetical protein
MRKIATKIGQEAIFLFIAELNGYKVGTTDGKLEFGKKCWVAGARPHDPQELIWAERLYKELYGYEIALLEGKDYYWSVPIELDVAASMLQIIGALLGDKQLLTITNVLTDGELNDPWGQINNVVRSKSKMVLMRQLYGSGQSAADILDAFEEDYTAQDIINLEQGLSTGAYGVANAFKTFIIKNCNLAPVIYPKVWNDQLEVPCNRHHVHGEKPIVYSMLNSKGSVQKLVHWQTESTPDTKAFKRWTVTGLIHGIDAQIVNNIMDKLDWAFDVHDAVICNPEDALKVRKLYAKELKAVYDNRETILNNYFRSVGIKATPDVKAEWKALKERIESVEHFECSMWAMK